MPTRCRAARPRSVRIFPYVSKSTMLRVLVFDLRIELLGMD
jgi:hypothetical protein